MGEFDQDTKRKVLQFSTGSSRCKLVLRTIFLVQFSVPHHPPIFTLYFLLVSLTVPHDGFVFLLVRSAEDPEMFPTSHTCFNQLVLPEYPSEDVLREKVLVALEHIDGFYLT
jgi:hypothetical protein